MPCRPNQRNIHNRFHLISTCSFGLQQSKIRGVDMTPPKNEFTNVTSIRTEALGEPGNRTFRILVNSDNSSGVIWLEKEQLLQLAMAIQQLLATITDERISPETATFEQKSPAPVHLDMRITTLSLGHDRGRGLFLIDAHETGEEEAATIRVWINGDQLKELSKQAFKVCAAGRPYCPLCNGPLDPSGHQCPRHNGHVKIKDL